MIKIFTDGGARGNPGPAAIGVYIEDDRGKPLAKVAKRIGETTNNVAEYTAVLEGLDWTLSNVKKEDITFFLDSELVCKQLNGLYKVKNVKLRELLFAIREKEAKTNASIYYKHIRREFNKKADALVNAALDDLL